MAKVSDRYLEERREEILGAAKDVFVRKGYDAATIQDIAAEADVAAGSIYRYFDNKADLIAAVTEWCCDEDLALFVNPSESVSPLLALLQTGDRVGREIASHDHRQQCILRLESFLAGTRDETVQASIAHTLSEALDRLTQRFRAAQEAGEIDHSIDPVVLAQTVHAFTAGISALQVPMGDDLRTAEVWATMVRLFSSLFLVDPAELLARIESDTSQPATEEGDTSQ